MQISNSIHILRHDFAVPVAPGKSLERFVYSVLIFGNGVTLIDCGVKGGHEKIFDYVVSRGRRIEEIDRLILSHSDDNERGERYLSMIDTAVKKHYLKGQASMDCCRNAIAELKLPPVFVVPVVHRAFLSHFD